MIKMIVLFSLYLLVVCIVNGFLSALFESPDDMLSITMFSLFWPIIIIALCVAGILWLIEWLSYKFCSFFEGFFHSFRKDK